jgi:hypothetical protein
MVHQPPDRRRPQAGDACPGPPSANLRRLLERMRRLGFGVIRGLHVRDGDPQFEPPFTIIRVARLTEAAEKPRGAPAEFMLNGEQRALQRQLALVGTGVIDTIKVHDGLPVHLEIQESA